MEFVIGVIVGGVIYHFKDDIWSFVKGLFDNKNND